MKHLLLLPFLLVGASPAAAESAEMKALSWLVGQWEGEGWIQTGPGGRQAFRGVESVESRLSGEVLVIEGRHFAADATDRLVHNAVALVSYDASRNGYRFYAKTVGRPPVDARAEVEDGVFVWFLDIPNGEIRYRIRETEAGEWHEVGERAIPSGEWVPFFEMTLHRSR